MKQTAFLALWLMAMASPFAAYAKDYDLTISHQTLNITGKPLEKVVVNGTLPAPTLRFKQGEEAVSLLVFILRNIFVIKNSSGI